MKCILFFSFIVSVSSAFECPSSKWFRFRNKCFLADTSKWITFQANVVFCDSLNATTVSIHSYEENNFIKSKLDDYPYWLGIRQVDFDANTYAWLDGTLYNYSNWDLRAAKKSCAGAFIARGEWNDLTNCGDKNHAFCQIDFDSPFYKMQSRINQLRQDLKDDRKAEESRLNETNARLDKAMNTTYAWITNLNLTFEAKLHEEENRLKKSNEKLEHKINLLNLSMTFMDSDFQLDLKNKDIQVDNINKEMAQLRLVDNKLEQASNGQNALISNLSSSFETKLNEKDIQINKSLVELSHNLIGLLNESMSQSEIRNRNTHIAMEIRLNEKHARLEKALNMQTALVANMSSDLKNKEREISTTNKELVRLSLIITRLENAILTQNELIKRMSSTSELKSRKR